MRVLVTGAAGFIGFHVAMRLIARGDAVVGLDNFNSYYDPALKVARNDALERAASNGPGSYRMVRGDIASRETVESVFAADAFDRVIHLAAQAGVRHSIENPRTYVESNIVGFTNILEGCRQARTPHLTYASSSSVYGANTSVPYREDVAADHPLQLYAASKRANELMAHSYAHLFALPSTGLRFFTVYGPWGRPDMALFTFTRAILAGEPVTLYSHGRHSRDVTYVDDVAEGVVRTSDNIAAPDPAWNSAAPGLATSNAPWRIFNIGNGDPVQLGDYVTAIEEATGRTAIRELRPAQPGDVPDTFADVTRLQAATGFRPTTPMREGVRRFVAWYRQYYGV